MKRTNKKGFTIVELVIVIAIIAILAAVLIPTFSTIIQKAQTSSDTQLIRNLNTALMLEDPAGDGYATAYDAVKACERQGYKVDVIVSKSKYNIAFYNDVAGKDHFVLLDMATDEYIFPLDVANSETGNMDTVQKKLNTWVVSNEVLTNGYSTYYVGEAKDITTSAGFDTGDVQGIASITYKNESTAGQNVVIRTNGGSLVIDDESEGTIYHYEKADSVKILECHIASYHEFGTVPFVEIAEGHIVFETGSAVSSVHVDTKYTDKAAGTKDASTFGNVEISVAANAAMPEFSRDSVATIADDGTKVCTLNLAGEKNDVVLFQNGIYEQIKVVNTTDGARWVDTSNATQATKTAADQLANNFEGAPTFKAGTEDTTRELVEADVAKVTDGGSAGILLVHNMDELQTALTNKAKYITFANEISYPTNGTGLVNVTYSCTIDGAGYALSGYGTRSGNKTTLAINNGGSSMVNVSFKNLTISNNGSKGRPIETRGNIGTINFDNVTINATGSGNTQCLTIGGNQATSAIINVNNSTFDAGSGGYPIITFNPIDMKINNSNIEGYCGVYFKYPDGSAGSFGSVLTAVNSTFNAPNLYNGYTNGFGVFVMETDDIKINLTDCAVNGKCHGTADQAIFYEDSFLEKEEESVQNEYNVYGGKTTINGIIFEEEYPYNFTSRIWNLTAGTYKEDPSAYVGNGYKAVDNGNGTWTIVKN